MRIKRRVFTAFLAQAALLLPPLVAAEQKAKVPRIGYLVTR